MPKLTAYEYLNKKVKNRSFSFKTAAEASIIPAKAKLYQQGYRPWTSFKQIPGYGWAINLIERARRYQAWEDVPYIDYLCIDFEVTTPRFGDYYGRDSAVRAMKILKKRFPEEERTQGAAGTHDGGKVGKYNTSEIAMYMMSSEFGIAMEKALEQELNPELVEEEEIDLSDYADGHFFLSNNPL